MAKTIYAVKVETKSGDTYTVEYVNCECEDKARKRVGKHRTHKNISDAWYEILDGTNP